MKLKKKIALVVDSDNWAFANIAKNISKNLINKYEFKIIPITYFNNNLVRVYIEAEDCDLIHFFWRGNIIEPKQTYFEEYIKLLGFTLEEFHEKFMNKIVTTAVYDHLFLDEDKKITEDIFSIADKYYVSSNILNKIYQKLDIKYKPMAIITDGVDLNDFYPINLERFSNIDKRVIKIGWVGNSAWQQDVEDFKGVNTILKPVIKELQNEGYNIEEYFADRQVRMIPHDKMVEYYSKIDVLVCTSKCEGTPNPVLEAMACGVPIISTKVGIVPDALKGIQKKYILKERTQKCLKNTLIDFINNLDEIQEISNINLENIKYWEWKNISKKFDKFFNNIIKTSKK